MPKLAKPKFSIRLKFLAVMTMLLAVCVSIYLFVASETFKEDKKKLLFELNGSMVSNLSAEIESVFRGYSDKMTLFALLNDKQDSVKNVIDDLLKNEPNIVYMSLSHPANLEAQFKSYNNADFNTTYAIDKDYFEKELPKARPVPFAEIQQTGEEIWNATIKNGPPLIGYGKSVIEEDAQGKPVQRWAVIAYIRVDQFLKSLPTDKLYHAFITNNRGHAIVHRNAEAMLDFTSTVKWPLVQKALGSQVKTSVSEYEINGEEYLGAFSKTFNNKIFIVSEADGKKAFSAIRDLIIRSLVFATMVMTLAFMAALLLSRSLTQPIETLVEGMGQVAEGNLDTQIKIKSKDEISLLADSFNSMIRDLKSSRLQLEEINRDLEQKVLDRTQKLAEQNRAIKETQEALLRTSRLAAIGEIAGHAAHEVLNPLTSLLARTKRVQSRIEESAGKETLLLKEIQEAWSKDVASGGLENLVTNWKTPSTIDPQKSLWDEDMSNVKMVLQNWEQEVSNLKRDTDFIINEGQRINKIISGMRTLSIVRGEMKSYSATTLLNDCITIMGDLYNQSKVNIEHVTEVTFDKVVVDRDEFIQSITNLLRNSLQAVKDNPADKKGMVKIRTFCENRKLIIELADNGPGISSDNQPKLFKTQFSTKSSDEGTGLGLGISRRFIRAFGGDIEFVNSVPFESTTFKISLPLQHSEEVAA